MTKAMVIATVRALGLSVRYQAVFHEWKIDYRQDDPRRSAESAYFTNDSDDAIATAKAMAAYENTK